MQLKPIASGKTKEVFAQAVVIKSKDVVTWGNQHQASMPGKAAWSTKTTGAMFRLLQAHGEGDIAYYRDIPPDAFSAPYCEMIKLEVVCRFSVEAGSSIRKRRPELPVGTVFETPEIEFFLKSSGKNFDGIELPDDDPFVTGWYDTGLVVHHPGKSVSGAGTTIPADIFGYDSNIPELLKELTGRTQKIGIYLRNDWALLGWKLGDFKVEYGIGQLGGKVRILLADVIDNDSWRLRDPQGNERSKQTIRDGGSIEDAMLNYELVARAASHLAEMFESPRSRG